MPTFGKVPRNYKPCATCNRWLKYRDYPPTRRGKRSVSCRWCWQATEIATAEYAKGLGLRREQG
jgi:hypothetical protein